MWPGFNSSPDPVCEASLLVLCSAPRGYSLGTSGFSSHQKPTTKTKNFLCNCAPRNTQRLSILLLLELQNFLPIDHFTVVSLVAWPLDESEARGDLALIETSLLFLC